MLIPKLGFWLEAIYNLDCKRISFTQMAWNSERYICAIVSLLQHQAHMIWKGLRMHATIWALHSFIMHTGHGTNPSACPRHVIFLWPNFFLLHNFLFILGLEFLLFRKINFYASLLNSFVYELPGMFSTAHCCTGMPCRSQTALFKCFVNCPSVLFPQNTVLHPKEHTDPQFWGLFGRMK